MQSHAEMCIRDRLYERDSHRHRGYMQEAEELAKSIQEGKKSREIEKNGQYYQCQCTPVYYSGRLRGYILGAWDLSLIHIYCEARVKNALEASQPRFLPRG